MTVRTRIAPSPTGDPHVGTAYIALFNYCFAKSQGGEFILRIEDTDQVRSTRESEDAILASLRWLGLSWAEGPDVGGPHGPYRQSERSELYQKHADELLNKGHAFRCFCTQERLADMRAKQRETGAIGYDGHCMHLTEQEAQAKLDEGVPHTVRMKVPREGTCHVSDLLGGNIDIDWSQVDMQILMKSDGLPTYHLANVVDDHYMQITHVLRGEEWISSAPKHILLYQYLGCDMPVLCHLPLLRNPDKSKLSKRKNPTSILYYERMGYMPEAMLNYLGRMAWSMPDESEEFTLAQMIEHFTLDRISLGGPIFDVTKLDWLNGRWLRNLDKEELAQRITTWMLNDGNVYDILPMVQPRLNKFSDLGELTSFFFSGLLGLPAQAFEFKKTDADTTKKILVFASWALDKEANFNTETVSDTLRTMAAVMDIKTRDFLKPFFVAITGKEVSTPLFETMQVLGRDICRARLKEAADTLGGVSKKQTKRWTKEFDATLRAMAEHRAANANEA